MRFFRFAMAIFLAAFTGVASAQTTVMFQNGLNGFNGLLEVYSGLGGVGPDMNVLGSDVDNTFLDGVYDTGDDTQGLLRFDGILNEIPAGATITSAVLEFTTSEVGNAQSGGPYGVSQLLVPFDENSTYAGAAMGWRFNQGEAARPLPNGFISLDVGETNGADVTPIVQAWVDGDPNHGFLITAGTTNGWSVITSGFQLEPSVRPKLTVEFTTGGNDRKPTTAFLTQSPTDNSNSMFIADANNNFLINADNLASGFDFLDGGGDETQALLRFDQIFVSEGGIVPDNATILQACLIVTTSDSSFSTNVGTGGEYGVREITSDWDGSNLFTDLTFGGLIDGEVGLIADAQASFDVTTLVEDYQNGQPNFGFNVYSTGTTDGWGIDVSTGTVPPQLKIVYLEDDVLLGDINCDGAVNLADVQPFVELVTAGGFLDKADINGDGAVNLGDVQPFVDLLLGG